ncbi:MAG: hypothetical protein IK118_04820 [Clostridia bacterium]|nr:hypothetical protein [Clostridia bacterium]
MAENQTTPEKKTTKNGTPFRKKTTKSKDHGAFFREVIGDNRFLFFISLLLAFFAWCLVSAYASPEVERTVVNVPISVSLAGSAAEQLGYQTFGSTEYYADVVVKGPKYQLSDSIFGTRNIRLTASLARVDSPGLKTLAVDGEIVDASNDISLVSISRDSISVYFDMEKEIEYTIEPQLDLPEGVSSVPDGYVLDTPILSVSTAIVTGPATEISAIERIVANVPLQKSLTANTTTQADVLMVTSDNSEPQYCVCDIQNVNVTLPVLKITKLPIGVSFINQPIAYLNSPLKMDITPLNVDVAIPVGSVDSMKTIDIGLISFSDINNKVNTFAVNTADIDNVRFLDDDLDRILVTVDASMMEKKKFEVKITDDTVTTMNLPEGFSVKYDQKTPISVTVIGPEASLAELSDTGIYAEVDYSSREVTAGSTTVPARFIVKSLTDCWCYGSYELNAVITGEEASD